ncbi:hypothetical protein ASPWEDRAFT_149847 [Aspergillus wentii DTO 134E9]|uniref:Prenylcysteine lyase domain-containing protein n=1 Tax=Aspergillus wentii DTO 134E9 TaxID=1073089 RepID=A0A1L9RVW0_ASPWE|nr:uncharacterized protein ASPWEDRAFT_149847 [Aspergillus wentii DTO 134E9]KAI9929231.1 hypothetical protein MW887_001639 [Aspergillus wentii]OJJ39066.1 hypothetical protein ASPWEDRAFT_149847 [Aspergillus wentii DTO 134E9]
MDSIPRNGFPQLFSHFTIIYYVVTLLFVPFSNAIEQQPLGTSSYSETTPKRVAIIGAGAAGSSAAYNLRKYADALQVPVNITVFERESYVGGRSTTVDVFDDPAYPVELGASIFVDVNYNLVNASKELGLLASSASRARPMESEDTIGIWDGEQFVFVLQDTYSWWNIGKLLWKYGLAPIRAQNLMKSTVNKFLQLYKEPVFPFKSLSDAAAAVGLLDVTASHGDAFLEKNNVSPDFARDIIQASTRVNYGQNLALIHGLESMVCLATDGAVAIHGGNWQIFDAMLKSSRANVKLNSTVNSIVRNKNGTSTITFKLNNLVEESLVFDEVVIAGPLQYSDISISPSLDKTPDQIPYVKLHVTLFSSPYKLSPKYFGLEGQVAETVLTTLPKGMNLGPVEKGVGPSEFWSISTLQAVKPPSTFPGNHKKHYVYKIFSPKQPSADFVAQILGIEKSEKEDYTKNSTIKDLPSHDISWYHEKIWHPYPYLYPRVTFEETSLAPNIWYTGGIESFISTMETSALMGKNVAALMSRSWQTQGAEKDGVKGHENRAEL